MTQKRIKKAEWFSSSCVHECCALCLLAQAPKGIVEQRLSHYCPLQKGSWNCLPVMWFICLKRALLLRTESLPRGLSWDVTPGLAAALSTGC